MINTAQFTVLNGTTVINQYEMEFGSPKELNDLFHEARKVWAEYIVEVDTYYMKMTYSHTYAEEMKRNLA
jgi:hypothetical protein